ncbi:MAG TPA: sel1 repeat family protein [Mesorhizobium sp.]
MARLDMNEAAIGATGMVPETDILFALGMMYATGRDCEIDIIAAHKWFNIAAIKGSREAAAMRYELTDAMTKIEIARALREAREWMTIH